ncbi:MAG: ABC transporter permease [Caldilineaceae bacterium]|nr:ABC transporter permease [Caldilineaceae bacterium]
MTETVANRSTNFPQVTQPAHDRTRHLWEFFRSILRNRLAALGMLIVLGLLSAALFAPWVAPYDPEEQFSTDARLPPSAQYLFGTDTIGRDVFSRVIYGTRVSLLVGIASMAIAATLGVTMGLVAGYYGGWADTILMRAMDALLAFPAVLLAIFIIAVLGPSLLNAILAVGIVYTPTFARLTRASALSIREKEYLEAARSIGARDAQIMWRVILRNSLSPIVVQFSLGVGYAILVEAGLSFLGLGVQPPTPAWGSMLGFGRNYMSIAPWLTAFPGLAIFVTVLGFNFVGDGLREALDPHMRRIS